MTKHSKNNKNKKQRGGQQTNGQVQPVAQTPTPAPTPAASTSTSSGSSWFNFSSSPSGKSLYDRFNDSFKFWGGKKTRHAKKSKLANKSKTQRRH
jgi:hypothetical protein